MKLRSITRGSATRALLIAAIVTAGGQASLQAAQARTTRPKPPARAGGPGLMGTIMSTGSRTLKISVIPSHKSVTVDLNAKTTYVVNGKPSTKQPNLKKGEQIQISGTKQKNGTYTARMVMVGAPGGPGPGSGGPPGGGMPPVNGTIVSATSSSLLLKTGSGTTRYTLSSSTRYLVNGKSSAHPTLKSGEQVHVMARRSGKRLVAQMVIIGAMPGPPSGAAPPGQ